MNSSSIQKDNIYIVANPDKILLTKNSDGKWLSKLTLNNITHNYIIFKVYINREQYYSANPSVGYIEPKGNVQITLKRITNDSDEEVIQSNDKFMIKAFISHRRITDSDEVKRLISPDDLVSPLTQALFLRSAVNQDNLRNSVQRSIRDSDFSSVAERSESIVDDRRSEYTITNVGNQNPFYKGSGSVDEWKKRLEEKRIQIKDLEHENEKLVHQKNNLVLNSKNYSKKVNVIGDKQSTQVVKNTYPMFFIVFVVTIGVIFGAFLNKLF